MLQRLSQNYKYILLLLIFISCQKQIITSPVEPKLLGIWQEKGYNNKIEIKENTIVQLVGYPLVKGDEITYLKSGNTLRCRFSSLIIDLDSFNLEILQLTDTYLKFRMQRTPLTYEIEFIR